MALGVGRPLILPDDEVMRTVERFKFYGYQPEKPKALAPKPKIGKLLKLGKSPKKRAGRKTKRKPRK
jgi:hypothetical protein